MDLLKNKNVLITGLLSNKSIAYGIAKAMHAAGANLAFTYLGEKFKDRITKFANEFNSEIVIHCDVSSDNDIDNLFKELSEKWDHLDVFVHSIAFAPADQLAGSYIDSVTREGFKIAHEISSYSLAALSQKAMPMMQKAENGGSILTLTYLGSQRAVANYNVMGIAKASLEANVRYLANDLGPHNIRVNAISAGPIRTLAASGIKGFKNILNANEKVVPLRRNITIDDVGNTALFLASYLANGITGEIIHVDSGYHAIDPLVVNNE